jgi:hypothetical protein
MKLGVYKREKLLADEPTEYTRYALYDFETEEWGEHSSGAYIKRVSENPSPEELRAKLELENKGRVNIVRTPAWVAEQDGEVIINTEPVISVAEGKQQREENNGPVPTTIEMEYRDEHGVRVIDDERDLSDKERERLNDNGYEIVSESEWDGIDFSDEFNFEFYTNGSEEG